MSEQDWMKEAKEKVFNKLCFIGSNGQSYLNSIVFPFIERLEAAAEARGRVEGLKLARVLVEKQQRSYLPKGRGGENVTIVSAPLAVIDREIESLSPTQGSSE